MKPSQRTARLGPQGQTLKLTPKDVAFRGTPIPPCASVSLWLKGYHLCRPGASKRRSFARFSSGMSGVFLIFMDRMTS